MLHLPGRDLHWDLHFCLLAHTAGQRQGLLQGDVLRDRRICWRCAQVEAFEESQKYKEGKCIIEKAKMCFEPAAGRPQDILPHLTL